ncbi:MAG: HAD family hydrolase [Candidatus Paceibacterota bacterium]
MATYVPQIPIVAIDWDATIADTFTPSPRGRGVEAGYRYALSEIFGDPELLDRIGGLCNRAPPQVIAAVLEYDRVFEAIGVEYYERHKDGLRDYVPAGKGMQRRHPSGAEVLTETLVRVRLQYLMPEISSAWPKPFDGVIDCLDELESRGIRIAIISSGHTMFIEKTCRTWGMRIPSIIVSDDDMRALGLPHERTCKPSPLLMQTMLERAYLSICGTSGYAAFCVRAYIGDCPIKDRGLAWNSEVRFGWFNPGRKAAPQGFGRNEFQFHSWNDLHTELR